MLTLKELKAIIDAEIEKGNGDIPIIQTQHIIDDPTDPEDYGHTKYFEVTGIYVQAKDDKYSKAHAHLSSGNEVNIRPGRPWERGKYDY